MPTRTETVSLADLADEGILIRPSEACAIVRELALQLSRGEIHGVPSAQVVRVSADGALLVEGPAAADGSPIARAAQLLESLLPGVDAAPERRASGALRLAIARGAGTLDLPPYPSLESFANALGRFAEPDTAAVARDLYQAWTSVADAGDASAEEGTIPPSAGELTISDIRRARRATGLTLGQIEERSRIPIGLLRQLEWGYFENWPTGPYGRVQLVRYARAAGLDEEIVVATILPQLCATAAGASIAGTEPAVKTPVVTPPPRAELPELGDVALIRPAEPQRRTKRSKLVPAFAAAALLTVAIGSAMWNLRTARVSDSTTAPPNAPAASPAKPVSVPDTASSRTRRAAAEPATTEPAKSDPVALPGDDPTYSPAFATEGSAFFYHAQGPAGSALMRADSDGAGELLRITRIVDGNSRNFHARPSPDGTRIAFDSDRHGERAVYVANADGTNVRRVTGDGYAAVPSWSPDGRSLIVVRAEPDRPKVWNLWKVDVQSGATQRLSNHPSGQPWGASWFPDGTRVAYSHEDRIFVMDLVDGDRRSYRSPKPGRLLRTPAVSPDGKRMIFQVHRDGAWVLELGDGSMRKVLADPTAEEFTWSPDGRRVAYHSRRTGNWGIWIMFTR